MLKRLFAVLVVLCLLAAAPAWAYDVYYQGEKLAESEQHFGQDCVLARAVFEKLGFDVQWRAEFNDLFLYHPERCRIRLSMDDLDVSTFIPLDYKLPALPYFNDDLLYVPLRLLEYEYCGYKLQFLPEQQRVEILEAERPEPVYPFADLTREQLAGIKINFTVGPHCYPVYTEQLEEADIEQLLALLPQLAYREPAFTGEMIEVTGGVVREFELEFADGRTLGFGEAVYCYYFFPENEELVAYVVQNYEKQNELDKLYRQLREKYGARVQETPQLD